ncbi:MAG: protease complex subunit PrcB family protein [Acidobacteria bacterium]|nr:protease complex subunit PrcB family protein [Acidobacteriota bacterium]
MFRLSSVMFLSLALCGASAAGCGPEQQRKGESGAGKQLPGGTPAPPATVGQKEGRVKTEGELKSLGAGGYSKVREPFVLVARDGQTYQELRELVGDLPALKDDFFRANAVVAAFLGQRRSGGYAVEIARGADGALRVSEKTPPKDAMTTMALTAPYNVVSYAAPEENPVRLSLGAAWQQAARPYRVTRGKFTMMGGFAGVHEPFGVTGTLGVLRHQHLATVVFDLKGDDPQRPRALADAATGAVNSGKLTLSVDPGTFILPPRNRARAEGTFGGGENTLTLTLEGMQIKVADGFGGRGEIEAEATAGPPQKTALDDDSM